MADRPGVAFGHAPASMAFVLVPNFSLIAFSSAVEPLRLANRIAGKSLYQWDLITLDANPVPSSSGVPVWCSRTLEDAVTAEFVVICSGLDVHHINDDRLGAWLRRRERQGAAIGAVCTGAFILARAGLLSGYRCTIHWANRASLIEAFSDLNVTTNLYEIDRNRFTCGGGTGPIDMVLSLIAAQHGRGLAAAVANHITHERIRAEDEAQTVPAVVRYGVRSRPLLRVLAAMEENVEVPLTRAKLAKTARLSERQIERLFRAHVRESPKRYYRRLRLQHARRLLSQSTLTVTEVAFACGFVSLSHFAKCYREAFGHAPLDEKRLRAGD